MNKIVVNKRFMGTLAGLSIAVILLGELSVDKGLISFAQGQTIGNIIEPIEISGMSLASFSKVPDIMESIVFVEEDTGDEGIEISRMSMSVDSEDTVGEIRTMSLVQEDKVVEDNMLEDYGIDVEVKTNDTVGVGSELTSILKSSVSKGDYDTLLRTRNSARHTDFDYIGQVVNIKGQNRDYLERLVQGEAGAEGFVGACLVAQTIRDTMVMDNEYDLLTIKRTHAYSGSLQTQPCQTVKDAVSYIFDEGGYVVQHRLVYFYAPGLVKSSFHESQQFITEHGGHRFFDRIGN